MCGGMVTIVWMLACLVIGSFVVSNLCGRQFGWLLRVCLLWVPFEPNGCLQSCVVVSRVCQAYAKPFGGFSVYHRAKENVMFEG